MIIQVESATAENLEEARRNLDALAQTWGQEVAEAPAEAAATAATSHDDERKAIDPVAVASLVLSIPSTALAVADIADRILKRRRAAELIDHAQQLADQQVTIYLMSPGRTAELSTLTPDQLLGLAGEDPAS